jgi:arsenate reductase
MAEGLLKTLYREKYEPYSAGTEPSRLNPFAVQVMQEIGIDISGHRSKSVDEFLGLEFDYVITVCDHAKETCPVFQGGKNYLHAGFQDPSEAEGAEEKKMAVFRRVRDEIKDWIMKTFA